MARRFIGFLICQLAGGLVGWWLGHDGGIRVGLVAGALGWLVVDSMRGERVLRWIRRGESTAPLVVGGLWGELVDRMRRILRTRDQELADSRQRLQEFLAAIQASPNGVVLLDPQGRIEWSNQTAAQQFGFDLQRDMQQQVGNLVRDPSFSAYFNSGKWGREIVIAGPGSSASRPVKLSVQLHPYGEGRTLLLSRDVTAVEQAEIMRRDFVANVSHELKTPLTVFTGFLETIREMPLSPDQTGQYLSIMAEQAQRMQGLLTDLLTLSALEADNTPAEARIDMSAVLATLAGTAEQLSGGRHHIELEIASGLDLLGSESEIISALGNLISNAVRYTPTGGRVTIRWEALEGPEGSAARFSVIDTGIGISPQHLPRLTERFYRVDASRSRESGGTGLGLAIVKHVLTRHESRLDIHSKPGAGSRFSAEFPARRILRAPAKTAARTEASAATGEQFAQPH